MTFFVTLKYNWHKTVEFLIVVIQIKINLFLLVSSLFIKSLENFLTKKTTLNVKS